MPLIDLSGKEITVFCSYSHKDTKLQKKLISQLKVLERNGLIKVWHDQQILPGDEWKREINVHLERANIILLLISADFITSEFCYSIEMARAMEKHNQGEARVIPIIARPCLWEDTPFGKLQALPEGKRAVTQWSNRDEAWISIARGIRAIIQSGADTEQPLRESSDEQKSTPLLPYLCDRNPQEDKLVEDLQSPVENMSRHPLFFIIYGSEYECHDKFRERLQRRSLRRLYNFDESSFQIEDYMLTWPSSYKGTETYFQALCWHLGNKFLHHSTATKEEIGRALARFPVPVIIHTVVSTENWTSDTPAQICAFIEFWNDSWQLPPGPHLIISLHIEYNRKRPEFVENEAKVRDFLKQLNASAYRELHLTVLPELSAIPEFEARNWARDDEHFQGFCSIHTPKFCDVDELLQSITSIYADPQRVNDKGEIPMQSLAAYLKDMLKEKRCRGDRP